MGRDGQPFSLGDIDILQTRQRIAWLSSTNRREKYQRSLLTICPRDTTIKNRSVVHAYIPARIGRGFMRALLRR
jgi:hypothetical protein